MKNILLILDNSVEYDFTKTILTKLGFNVMSMLKGADMRSKFRDAFPDLVITSVLGSEQQALDEFAAIRAKRGIPKFIWVGPVSKLSGLSEVQKKLIDQSMPSPIQPEKLVGIICSLLEIPEDELLKKYHDLYTKSFKGMNKQGQKTEKSERLTKYDEILANVEMQDKVFSAKELRAHNDDKAGQLNTTELLEQKKAFVKKMFKG